MKHNIKKIKVILGSHFKIYPSIICYHMKHNIKKEAKGLNQYSCQTKILKWGPNQNSCKKKEHSLKTNKKIVSVNEQKIQTKTGTQETLQNIKL